MVDTVFERQACADHCRRTLAGAEPVLVGLYGDVAELERRERVRGDRPIGLAARQAAGVHDFCDYHLRLQTDRTPVAECATRVLTA